MAKKKSKLQPKASETNPEFTEVERAEMELKSAQEQLAKAASAPVFSGASQMDVAESNAEAREELFGAELVVEANQAIVAEMIEAEKAKSEDEEGSEAENEPELSNEPRPPAKMERLQKILAAAGVASRRHAERLIEEGRVQVNGKVVTLLGTKADAARDHIRVDGKLLQGAERLRYFVLNKPRGYVTTVKDPEGRPTVMQFFEKMRERLYPVGRLDYLSEGLLVVTNDGELANRLTKASSGVEKTYLVKVAGQPAEAEIESLRKGVAIERGASGSAKVVSAPARIRQVRQGDNPWFEVVLIEGRNRELRKMFEEIGHFVEKIRRVGYGPLVLDLEPGKLRELEPRELDLLRKAAEGKLTSPKSKEVRRRNAVDAGILPTVRPKPSGRPPQQERPTGDRARSFRPERAGKPDRPYDKSAHGKPFRRDRFRPGHVENEGSRPAAVRPFPPAKPAWVKPERAERSERPDFRRSAPPRREAGFEREERSATRRPERRFEEQRSDGHGKRPGRPFSPGRPPRPDRQFRPERPPKPGRPSQQGSDRSFGPPRSAASGDRPSYGTKRRFESRPASDSARRAERKSGPGWKPKPAFGGAGKPAGGARSKPRPGGFKNSGYKGKPSGPMRPGGKKRA